MDPDTPDGSHITRRTSRNVCKSLKVAPTPAGVPATPSKASLSNLIDWDYGD
ncbi:hypothetical protein HPP92_016883 [Vanilla planifolia]|uniref:Uncharacterized protein n=1 Tax=Vanilla planifolia TaxID=51239 RepID=A0A835QP29_VANPL|nr:hypothetical protein HPP92_016883 [Vanilla planifolia]